MAEKADSFDSEIIIREYSSSDYEECLRLFKANTPKYFAEQEVQLFENYLHDGPLPTYFVAKKGDLIVACGGGYYSEELQAGELHWGMVDPAAHRQGFGRMLVLHRVAHLRMLHGSNLSIVSRTSQLTEGFFAKLGFVETKREANHWGPGLNLVEMWLHD